MTRAVVVAFHKYQPYGGKYYDPIYDYFVQNLEKVREEFDRVYFVDSNWDINHIPDFGKLININPHLRYYDAYKEILPQVLEDNVLFVDNDMVIYKPGVVKQTFDLLEDKKTHVVSIYDTIGEKRLKELNGQSKFCPYWFATKKELLMEYRECEWGPVPWGETLSELTVNMLADKLKPKEIPEDKSGVMFDGSEQYHEQHVKGGRGYYHIRSGSVGALLLAYKFNDHAKYLDYIEHQPMNEFLRQIAWYWVMCAETQNIGVLTDITDILKDLKIGMPAWNDYMKKFRDYHGV